MIFYRVISKIHFIWTSSSFYPFFPFHFIKLFLIKMKNLNFHSTAKLNSHKICSNTWTVKFNSTKIKKFCGFCEPWNLLPTNISDIKIPQNQSNQSFQLFWFFQTKWRTHKIQKQVLLNYFCLKIISKLALQ